MTRYTKNELNKPGRSMSHNSHQIREDKTPKEFHSSDESRHRTSCKHKKSKHKHTKKKKKRSHSSSSSSSSDSSSSSSIKELKLLQRLEAERLRIKQEKHKQKELLKAKETPEEKRARRLKEKQEKERKRRERMGWDNEYQCYTNQDNPFGDSALTNTFVWTKKLAKEGVRTVSREELEARNRQKQLENKIELEKVKQRRVEREAERAAREAEAGAAARAREAAHFAGWARQEDAFHLHQARLRSQIRIRDGRAKPIDLLAWYVSSEESAEALEMHEPYAYLNGLQPADLEDLLEDIRVYRDVDSVRAQLYWRDLETIARSELAAARRGAEPARGALHRAVADDVSRVFRGKTPAQLAALQDTIRAKLAGDTDTIDVGYWESLLAQLEAHAARARLRDRHQQNLRRKLQLLKAEQGVDAPPTAPAPAGLAPAAPTPPPPASPHSDVEEEEEEEDAEAAVRAEYARGGYSPEPSGAEPGTLLTEPAADEARLAYLRAQLHHARGAAAGPAGSAGVPDSAALGAGADSARFSVEAPLGPLPPPLWADKYRPRKPRYFNRVHTGFEWNKYNQTHYDMDNPPPKIVQGYKFNIFYPDLIDAGATPSFALTPCTEDAEFAVLRFSAGPPYEDIAFKIVNREWEYSYKRGFRCHFHNNIFQLWFHFKRYRYRR